MANPPGVQLHACKCHNLKRVISFFDTMIRYMIQIKTVRNANINSSFHAISYTGFPNLELQELFWFGYTFQLGIRRLGNSVFGECGFSTVLDGFKLPIPPSLHSGRFGCFFPPSNKNPCANDALALSKESSRALQPGFQ